MNSTETGAEAAILTRTFKIGRYTATMTVQRPAVGKVTSAVIEWHPDVPRHLSGRRLRQYRRRRDVAAAELAAALGGTLAILEV